MSKEIDHTYTDEVVCPYCGYEDDSSWEWFRGDFNDEAQDEDSCGKCGKPILATQHITIRYSTEKVRVVPVKGSGKR